MRADNQLEQGFPACWQRIVRAACTSRITFEVSNRRSVADFAHCAVPVIVKLAQRKILLSEVMRLGTGAIIEFMKRSDEPLELLINNKVIAVGETVKVGENFGLRISQVGELKQIIQSMSENH